MKRKDKVAQVTAKLDRIPIPKLIPIDLSQAVKHECPGIKEGNTEYLAKIGKFWRVVSFSRQWFGLTTGVCQFDAPGYNSSNWEALYEIVE